MKKECSDFIDHYKSREVAEISNKGGVRSCKKPLKLTDYEFQGPTASGSDKPPAKKARKPLEPLFGNCSDPKELELLKELDLFAPETEANTVLKK